MLALAESGSTPDNTVIDHDDIKLIHQTEDPPQVDGQLRPPNAGCPKPAANAPSQTDQALEATGFNTRWRDHPVIATAW